MTHLRPAERAGLVFTPTAPTSTLPSSSFPWVEDPSARYPDTESTKSTNFDRSYPVDPVGAEADDDARIWTVYHDRVRSMDEDTIAGWNDSINFLLIFAGLFSAVLTAFVIEISGKLEPDFSEISARALVALLSGTTAPQLSLAEQLNSESFKTTTSARSVNAMWFVSLTLAVTVSMLAILAKQWIVGFSTRMRSPAADARRWAHRHRRFRDGLDQWHLNAFISGLSVTLHAAVALFLAGLNVHLYALDRAVFIPVATLSFTVLTFYISATLAPLWFGTCPTLTPQLVLGRRITFACYKALGLVRHETSPQFDEEVVLDGEETACDLSVLSWMVRTLPAGHDVDVALDVVGALDKVRHLPLLVQSSEHLKMVHAARARLARLNAEHWAGEVDSAAVARALRCSLFLEDDGLHPTKLAPFLNIRHNDVFILAAALQLQIDAADRRLDDWVRGRLRFLVEPLADWSVSSCAVRHGAAMLEITRNIIWKMLRRMVALQVLPEQTNVGTAALLVTAFGHDSATRKECHALITPALTRIIRSKFTGSNFNPIREQRPFGLLRSLQVWAFLLVRHTIVNGSMWGVVLRSPFDAMWTCYSRLLEDVRFIHAEHLTLPEAEELLRPFANCPPRSSSLSPSSLKGAMILLAPSARLVFTRGWSKLLGDATFSILQAVSELDSGRRADLGPDVSSFISQLHGHRDVYQTEITPREDQEEGTEDVFHLTPLNLLTARAAGDGSAVSCWSICCDIPGVDDGALVPVATSFMVDLLALAGRGLEIGPMVDQLLGGSRGRRLILARPRDETMSVNIALNGAVLDKLWWSRTRSDLYSMQESAWLAADTGYDTPQLFVAAVEQRLEAEHMTSTEHGSQHCP